MVAETIYNPTIKMPFVTTGIQLFSSYRDRINRNYYRYTTVEVIKTGYCLNCGNPFFTNVYDKNKNIKFCSTTCSNKYYHRKLKEENLKIAYKHVDRKEFSEFYKKYSNFVYSKIYEQDHKYTEDLIDWWNEQAIRMFYCIKKWEIKHGRECNRFVFLAKAVIYAQQNIQAKRKNEIFYDECNRKTQQMILGDYNSIYD